MELELEEVVIYPYFSPYFISSPSIIRDMILAVVASILSAVILKLLPLRSITDYLILHLKGKELDSKISEFFDLYCDNTRNGVKDGPHHKYGDSFKDKFIIVFLGVPVSKYLKEFNLDGRESMWKYTYFLKYVEGTPRLKVKNHLDCTEEELELMIKYAKIKRSIIDRKNPYHSILNHDVSWESWRLEYTSKL